MSYEKLEKYCLALKDFKKTKEFDPGNFQAEQGIQRVTPWAAEEEQERAKKWRNKLKNLTQMKE